MCFVYVLRRESIHVLQATHTKNYMQQGTYKTSRYDTRSRASGTMYAREAPCVVRHSGILTYIYTYSCMHVCQHARMHVSECEHVL